MSESDPDLQSAAIICEHVANGAAILFARRDENVETVDSGWQFLCNKVVEEDYEKAKVWLLREVLEQEPSLHDYMLLRPGSEVVRSSKGSPWEIRRK
jgi:hypothetical protein